MFNNRSILHDWYTVISRESFDTEVFLSIKFVFLCGKAPSSIYRRNFIRRNLVYSVKSTLLRLIFVKVHIPDILRVRFFSSVVPLAVHNVKFDAYASFQVNIPRQHKKMSVV